MKRVCLVPKVSGVGGMVSFKSRFSAGLDYLDLSTTDDIRDETIDSILVIGGTRDFYGLLRAKKRGVRIVQRLNGMNWLHRRLRTGWRHFLRGEYGNFVLRFIRSWFADHIVYQSAFAKDWWERSCGVAAAPSSIIYNAVDLDVFSPQDNGSNESYSMPDDYYRVLLVEGSLLGGYEIGIESAVLLVEMLNSSNEKYFDRPVELVVAGRVSESVQHWWSSKSDIQLIWAGLVLSEQIPELDRSAHLLYSADINAACPNAVIEALACGTPVLGYDTGALPELVTGNAGRVVPYGRDPWKLEAPDIQYLAAGAVEILRNQVDFRKGARRRAETVFGLDRMADSYLSVLFSS